MTDADLRALFEAWLGQPSSAHRTCDVIGAMVRHHGQAMLALPTYPPQIRAQSPAEAPPAAEEGSGGVQEPEDRRGHATGAPGDFRCRCIDWSDIDGCCKKRAPAITHAEGSPLRADRLPPEVPVAEVSLTRDVREPGRKPRACPRPSGSVCQCGWLGNIRIGPRDCMDGYRTTESDAERFARAEAMFGGPRRSRNLEDAL